MLQDPAAAQQVPQIRGILEDTQQVLFKTLDQVTLCGAGLPQLADGGPLALVTLSAWQVMERGQSLESIMEQSDDLSSSSMAFYKTSKRNQCCTIL